MLTREQFVIHIIDDDDSMRTALARVLRSAGFEAKSHPSAGAYLVAEPDDRPYCLLLDLEMPDADGLALQQALLRSQAAPPIIFMSAYSDVPRTVRAIKAGAFEFLTKPIATELLLATLDSVMLVSQQRRKIIPHVLLTDREQTVLGAILDGRLNKQIAAELRLSERTIKSCRAGLMAKLGASSLAELIQKGEPLIRH